jgi:hypothetical protein
LQVSYNADRALGILRGSFSGSVTCNEAPTANDDTGIETTPNSVKIPVLANDADPELTPNQGFSGLGSFDYIISNNKGGTDTATVTITVLPPPPPDTDEDGVPDASDNCPEAANPQQENADGDGMGEACDPDDDNDTIPDASDRCPDSDDTVDEDHDGIPDCIDSIIDSDNDGVSDAEDKCPVKRIEEMMMMMRESS